MKLGDNIFKMRKKMGFSQEELADKCQVSRQAIAKWESMESVPSIEKIIFLADMFEVTLDELVGRVNIDKYTNIKSYLLEFAASDIPEDDDDDISSIVKRYLLFVEGLELSSEDKLRGLQELFLHSYKF